MTGDRMKTVRPFLFVVTALSACAVFALGYFRDELGEVLFNAAML